MKKITLLTLLTFLLMGSVSAQAVMLDLSSVTSSGWINGAFFSRTHILGQGTGNFDPFLRVQANGDEAGYNTDGDLEFDSKPGIWTHSVTISDIPAVTINNILYREIILDAGEPGQTQNTLVLDTLDLYLLGSSTVTGYPDNFPLAARKYTLEDNNYDSILLDNIIGNGAADLFAYIPDSVFVGGDEFLYLYTELDNSGGTFEEWGIDANKPLTGSGVVPEPISLLTFGAGISGLFYRRKRMTA